MVGSDQFRPQRLAASLGRGSRGRIERSDDNRVLSLNADVLLHLGFGEANPKKDQPRNEAQYTSFRFVPNPIMGRGRAVKGRDERPAGALDRPPRAKGDLLSFFLDSADAFIDGLPFVQLRRSMNESPLVGAAGFMGSKRRKT